MGYTDVNMLMTASFISISPLTSLELLVHYSMCRPMAEGELAEIRCCWLVTRRSWWLFLPFSLQVSAHLLLTGFAVWGGLVRLLAAMR